MASYFFGTALEMPVSQLDTQAEQILESVDEIMYTLIFHYSETLAQNLLKQR